MNKVQEFYNRNQFPGHYSISDFDCYQNEIINPYLKLIYDSIKDAETVIDIGCGSGLVVNLLAKKYPLKSFTAIDFADSIVFAKDFARQNNLNNINYIKCDILDLSLTDKFDVVICQGVLHHIPNYLQAYSNIKGLVGKNGTLLLGLYHPLGKFFKKFYFLNYASKVLEDDQERNPYEVSYTINDVKRLVSQDFFMVDRYPRSLVFMLLNHFYKFSLSGGIILYNLKRI